MVMTENIDISLYVFWGFFRKKNWVTEERNTLQKYTIVLPVIMFLIGGGVMRSILNPPDTGMYEKFTEEQ